MYSQQDPLQIRSIICMIYHQPVPYSGCIIYSQQDPQSVGCTVSRILSHYIGLRVRMYSKQDPWQVGSIAKDPQYVGSIVLRIHNKQGGQQPLIHIIIFKSRFSSSQSSLFTHGRHIYAFSCIKTRQATQWRKLVIFRLWMQAYSYL